MTGPLCPLLVSAPLPHRCEAHHATLNKAQLTATPSTRSEPRPSYIYKHLSVALSLSSVISHGWGRGEAHVPRTSQVVLDTWALVGKLLVFNQSSSRDWGVE
jgi:hypothetical protein